MSQNEMDFSDPGDETSSTPLRSEAKYNELKNQELATRCLEELGNYQRNEPCDEKYGLELLRRATMEGDSEAWEWVQHCFSELVHAWLHRHPSGEAAKRLESEENYIALTFGRFWQATALNKKIEFRTLAAALDYLRASLNGAILDTLRSYTRPKEVSLPEPGVPGEPYGEDQHTSLELWEIIQSLLPNPRERRLAYLLYCCGLKPREIIECYPQEWGNIQEIYCLRRKIVGRLARKADQFGW